jgi:hypothetical protein
MRVLRVVLLLALAFVWFSQPARAQRVVKVKIEATELDKAMLLDKLNKRGKGHGLKFEQTATGYDYRVVFSVGMNQQRWIFGTVNTSAGAATVYDRKGAEIFTFKRVRSTDKGVTDLAAKEIIRRLVRWWHTPQGKTEAP